MKRALFLWAILGVLSVIGAGAQSGSVIFFGEVSRGQTFRKDISHGLEFVLNPSTLDPGKITGWTIEVTPTARPSHSDCTDYVWVVNPPYRSYNTRFLDTSYGITAQEALRTSPRDFKFVLNCADYETERNRVDIVLWPYNYPKAVVDKALAELGTSPLGNGNLWIQDYRISPGEKAEDGSEPDIIEWIKFKVEIEFPSSRTPPHDR